MKKKKNPIPKTMSLVKCVLRQEEIDKYDYPFNRNSRYVFLGEITNMPGHCVVMNFEEDGKIIPGYHTEDFAELTEDEL
jgi:hypothetical protein